MGQASVSGRNGSSSSSDSLAYRSKAAFQGAWNDVKSTGIENLLKTLGQLLSYAVFNSPNNTEK